MNGERFSKRINRIIAIAKCLLSYFLVVYAVAAIFTGIILITEKHIEKFGAVEILVNSIHVFWGMTDRFGFEIYTVEIVISHVIDFLYSALMVRAFLEDVGKLIIVDHFCINSDNSRLIIGYCYQSDPGEFLYNVTIIVRMLTYADIKSGRSEMNPAYKTRRGYIMIRGVHYVEIELDDRLKSVLKELSDSDENEENLILNVLIKGQNSSGGWVSRSHNFFLRDCLNGYYFVPVQKKEYDKGKRQDYVNMRYFGRVMECKAKSEMVFNNGIVHKRDYDKIIINQEQISNSRTEKFLELCWDLKNDIIHPKLFMDKLNKVLDTIKSLLKKVLRVIWNRILSK